MPILNYSTTIKADKTIAEITKCLVNHGATKISLEYDCDKNPVAITFFAPVSPGVTIGFYLSINYDGVLKAMKKDKKVPQSKCTVDQAINVGWRIRKVWIEGQMAIIESELAGLAEVFLPYAVGKSGKTLFEEISQKADQYLLLN